MTDFSLIRGRRMRVTRLDGCGGPVLGPDSVVTTKGFISVGLEAQTEEGEDITVTNANGDIEVSDIPPPKFTGYEVEISLTKVNPNLVNLFTGQPLVTDEDDEEAIGFRVNSGISLDESGFALELWSGVPAAVCEPGQDQTFGYMLVPFLKGGVLGDFTVENGPVSFTISGAVSKDGSSWGVGPFDVIETTGGPAPLKDPIDSQDHLHMQLTTLAPPEPSPGATALGVEATGAVAATGAATPANSYFPANLVDLQADEPVEVVASPATAWTTGQHITLRDGSFAHWDGDSWEAGVA